jgi:hypothetical protein
MRLGILCWFLLILAIAFRTVSAGELKEIDLTDGTTIVGDVQSLSNGIYTIQSDSLGKIKIEASKVRSIHAKAPSSGSLAGSGTSAGELQSLQKKMLSDKEIMSLIQALQDDPDFKKVLEDPEIMKAVNAGDVAALQANPRFMKLLNSVTVKEIESKLK